MVLVKDKASFLKKKIYDIKHWIYSFNSKNNPALFHWLAMPKFLVTHQMNHLHQNRTNNAANIRTILKTILFWYKLLKYFHMLDEASARDSLLHGRKCTLVTSGVLLLVSVSDYSCYSHTRLQTFTQPLKPAIDCFQLYFCFSFRISQDALFRALKPIPDTSVFFLPS